MRRLATGLSGRRSRIEHSDYGFGAKTGPRFCEEEKQSKLASADPPTPSSEPAL
jgi:hypothetical protein